MGRPKKAQAGAVPTRERIQRRALELFAEKGFEAVTVREITGSLGLNEASLYNHFRNKAALLDAILDRLEERLIEPGFRVPPPEFFRGADGPVDPAEYLIEGAKRFFRKADEEILLTWRMVMIGQFRYETARRCLENRLLDAPLHFFVSLLESMKSAGCIRGDADCFAAGRIIASLFFTYSFRANLKAAWGEGSDDDFSVLSEELRALAAALLM